MATCLLRAYKPGQLYPVTRSWLILHCVTEIPVVPVLRISPLLCLSLKKIRRYRFVSTLSIFWKALQPIVTLICKSSSSILINPFSFFSPMLVYPIYLLDRLFHGTHSVTLVLGYSLHRFFSSLLWYSSEVRPGLIKSCRSLQSSASHVWPFLFICRVLVYNPILPGARSLHSYCSYAFWVGTKFRRQLRMADFVSSFSD